MFRFLVLARGWTWLAWNYVTSQRRVPHVTPVRPEERMDGIPEPWPPGTRNPAGRLAPLTTRKKTRRYGRRLVLNAPWTCRTPRAHSQLRGADTAIISCRTRRSWQQTHRTSLNCHPSAHTHRSSPVISRARLARSRDISCPGSPSGVLAAVVVATVLRLKDQLDGSASRDDFTAWLESLLEKVGAGMVIPDDRGRLLNTDRVTGFTSLHPKLHPPTGNTGRNCSGT